MARNALNKRHETPAEKSGGVRYERFEEDAELLIIAARTNDTAQIRLLLEDSADVNATDENGWTALAWAILRRHAAAATVLVEAGADAERETRDGWTPMTLAIKTGNATIIEIAMGGLDRNETKQ